MITIKSENPVKLESVLQVSSSMAEKEKKIKQSVIKHVLRDLHISHMFEGPVSKAGVLVDHDINIEEKINELKKAHRDFLTWLDNYELEEEQTDVQCTDAPISSLEKYKNVITGICCEAIKEGIGMCIFITDGKDEAYQVSLVPRTSPWR